MASEPFVSIVTPTNKEGYMQNLFDNYTRQNYKNKELIIILNNNRMSLEKWQKEASKYENVSVYRIDQKRTLGACRNLGAAKAKYDFIANFDDDDYYGPNYLKHAMKVFEKVDTDIVGKRTTFVYLMATKRLIIYEPNLENRFVNHVPDGTTIIKKHVFDKVKYPNITLAVEKGFLRSCISAGFKLYSMDKYDYVIIRNADKNKHTWRDSDWELLQLSQVFKTTDDFTRFVNKNE